MKQIIFSFVLILACCAAVFTQGNETACPKISLALPGEVLMPDDSSKFIVKMDEAEKFNLGYEWKVSLGAILKGQGTSEIEFSTKGLQNTGFDISVKINGLPQNCPNQVTDYLGIAAIPPYHSLDDFGKIKIHYYRHRLDSFITQLMAESDSEGIIELRFDRKDNRNYKVSLLNKIQKHFNFRKFPLTRIAFLISEDDSERTVFHMVAAGSDFLEKIRDDDDKLIKGAELQQRIKELFPKK